MILNYMYVKITYNNYSLRKCHQWLFARDGENICAIHKYLILDKKKKRKLYSYYRIVSELIRTFLYLSLFQFIPKYYVNCFSSIRLFNLIILKLCYGYWTRMAVKKLLLNVTIMTIFINTD